MVKSAMRRGSFRIAGAVDTDPAKVGQDLGTLCGIAPLGVTVAACVEEALAGTSAQVAVA